MLLPTRCSLTSLEIRCGWLTQRPVSARKQSFWCAFSAHLQISVSDMIKNSVIKVDPVKGSTFVVVMDKDTTQAKLYEHYLSFFLPEGMLNFFELVWMETESLTSRESQKDLAYTGVLHILLD